MKDVLFKQAVFGQASVLALGPESEANVHKIEENFFDLMDFSLATIPEVGRDEGEPISAKSDSDTGRANDGKAIAIGMIFESLLVVMSRSNPTLFDELVKLAVYGQASVLALGPESEANVHKIQEIYDVLIDFAMCATGVDDSACDALPDRDPSFSLVDSGIGTNSSSYDQVNAGKAIALGMLDFSIPLSRNPSLSNYFIPTSAYGRASVLALGPESEANIDKAMEVYLELIDSYALGFESQTNIGKAIAMYTEHFGGADSAD